MDATSPTWDRHVPDRLRPVVEVARPWLSPGAFVGGFVLDMLTLRRVDDVGDNLQLTLYLVGAALLLVVERRTWHGRNRWAFTKRWHPWIRYGLQVLFGGLFSAYFIFYSRSATLGPSVGFCLLLAGLMLVNELRFAKLRPDPPMYALFFFSILSYLLFAVPTWTGWLGWGTRIAAAILALGASGVVVAVVHLGGVRDPHPLGGGEAPRLGRSLLGNGLAWVGMVVGLFVAMLVGLVPPVPLALAEAGVYHGVRHTPEGYEVVYDAPPWYAPWRRDDRVFRFREGDRVHCFTAVFAPSGTALQVFHAWDFHEDGAWVETDRIPWQMKGGRDDGWRSWTAKRHVAPGAWRVRVVSEHGEELGRVRFDVVADEGPAPDARSRIF